MAMANVDISACRKILADLLVKESIRYGDFTLSSGLKSDYFIDVSKVTGLGNGAWLIAHLIWEGRVHVNTMSTLNMKNQNQITAFAGPMSGADPIIGALLFLA